MHWLGTTSTLSPSMGRRLGSGPSLLPFVMDPKLRALLQMKTEQQASGSSQEHEVPNYHRTSSVDLGSPTEAPLGMYANFQLPLCMPAETLPVSDAVPNHLRTPNLGLRSTSLPNVKEHNLPMPSSSSLSHYQPRRHSTLDTATFPLPLCGTVETLSFSATNKSSSTVSREHGTVPGDAASPASATINDDRVSNSSPQGFDMESLSKQQFPTKLYAALELSEKKALGRGSGSISWLPDGRAFTLLDEQLFMTYVVPLFFKQTKIRSFQRQLNLWGFKRVEPGKKHSGAWYHRSFLRGAPDEIKKMVRVDIKRNSKKSNAREDDHNDSVPDFHSMPPLPPSKAAKPFSTTKSESPSRETGRVPASRSQAESSSRDTNSLNNNDAISAASSNGSSASADNQALDEFANFIGGAIKML